MFQENEKQEYYNRKAPDELKNRTWSSIQLEKQKVAKRRQRSMVMAACVAGAVLVGNNVFLNSTIVKVNDMPISYLSVQLGDNAISTPAMISEERSNEPQKALSLEIDVENNAHIEVSEGGICKESDEQTQMTSNKELDIQGKTVIFWYVEGDSNITATCTITTDEKEYEYVLEKEYESWRFRLKKAK